MKRLLGALALALLAANSASADDNRLIYGIHDSAGWPSLKGQIGWVLETLTVRGGDDPLGYLRPITDSGVTVIARVNNGYGTDGTIPAVGPGRRYASDQDFANAVAEMARKSPHVRHWIIGNETNLSVEWPEDGAARLPLTVDRYFECYAACYDVIKKVRPDALVMPAPVAPYAPDLTGDGNSLAYFTKLMRRCEGKCDAVALHAYTHGQDPRLAASEGLMGNSPDMHSDFRVYRDFLAALPDSLRSLPVYVTECDPGHFTNANTGWVQAIFHEVRDWNAQAGTQKIRCVCLYRWLDDDPGYGIVKCPEVEKDLEGACAEKVTWPIGAGIVGALAGGGDTPPVEESVPEDPPEEAASSSHVYTIDFGDTLSAIARSARMTVGELLDYKGDTDTKNRERLAASSPLTGARKLDANLIFPGQQVLVPD